MIRKNRRQRLSNFLNECFQNRAIRNLRKSRRTGLKASGQRSDMKALESLEDRLLLTYVAPDELLGIFEPQGGAGADRGDLLQVDTTDTGDRITGGVEEILAHPTDPDILYAASVNGGIWKTTNGTSANPTWEVQTDNLFMADGVTPVNQGLSFGAISFDLTDSIDSTPYQTLVAATALSSSFNSDGDANPGDPEGGIVGQVFVTFDGGDTWTNPGSVGLEGQNIIGIEMEFDRTSGEYIIVAASSEGADGSAGGGLFRSTDGGATFSPVTTVTNDTDFATDGSTNALTLIADPTVANPADNQSGRLYAGTTGTASGLYRSDDFGATWTRIDQAGSDVRAAITSGNTNAIEVTVHPVTGRIYVGVLHNGQLGADAFDSATGIGGIFFASDADQNTPTWITMDNPWAPVNITPITLHRNSPDPAQNQNGPQTPPAGIGPAIITAPNHRLISGDTILIRNSPDPALNRRWTVSLVDGNRIALNGSPALQLNVAGGELMRIESAVGPATSLAEDQPQGQLHFSLTTDPTDHNTVYVGLNELDVTNEMGGTATHANLWRGDITQPAGQVNVSSVSRQWESLVGDSSPESGQSGTANSTEPHRGTRSLTFDANDNLLESSDGGVFRRTSPLNNAGDWTSLAGNLNVAEYHSVAYDTVSNAIVAGSVDNGTQQALVTNDGQPDSFEVVRGSDIAGEILIQPFGIRIKERVAGGSGADVGVGQLANGNSLRYYSHEFLGQFTTAEHDAAGNLVSTQTRNLQVTDGTTLTRQRGTPLAVNALFGDRFIIGAENGVYESFNRGDTIDNASVAVGATVQATPNSAGSVAYGGRSSNDYGDNPFIIYAGDVNGSVWSRNQSAGDFTEEVVAAGNPILDVEINPSEWSEAFALTNNSIHRLFIDPDSDPPVFTSNVDVTGNLLAILPPGSELFSIEYINGTGSGVEGVVVGTSTGIYATTIRDLNLGRSNWFQFGSGLPDVQVMDMDYDSEDDTLILGTLGRGSWKLDNASLYFTPKVSLTVDNEQIFEDATAGSQVATVTATLSRPNLDSDVIIELGSSGSASFTETTGAPFNGLDVNNDDYYREINGVAGNQIVIPAGQLTGTATFGVNLEDRTDDTTDDRFDEVTELIQVTASIVNSPEAEILQTISSGTYTGTTGAITDDDVTEYTVDVTDTGLITDLDLTLNIEHTEVSQLRAELESPTGTRITLFNNLNSGQDVRDPIFDDEAVASINSGLPPYTGRFRPQDALSGFDGEELAGTWKLIITDKLAGETGELLSWSMTANRATDPTELPSIEIIDNDAAPMVRLVSTPASINEGDENNPAGYGVVTAELIDPVTGLPTVSGVDVTVPITFGGTATYPDNDGMAPDWTDYLPLDADAFPLDPTAPLPILETITISSGEQDGSLRIRPIDDPYNEPDPETAVFGFGTIVNGSPSTFAGDFTEVEIDIVDNDAPPEVTLSVSSNSVTEDQAATPTTTFTATIAEYTEFDVIVFLQLDGSSTALPADFTIGSSYTGALPAGAIGGILIPAGQLSGDLTLTAVDDAFFEGSPNEVATLSIQSIQDNYATDTSADGQPQDITIIDNDAVPVVTIAFAGGAPAADIFEGVPGSDSATITATLDQAAGHDVVVTIDRDGTVTNAAQDEDFTLTPDGDDPGNPEAFPITITIPAGQVSGTVTASFDLEAFDDDIDEPDQFVNMFISGAIVGAGTNASFNPGTQIQATIIDDDGLPEIELLVDGTNKQQTISENPEEEATITAALTAGSVTSEKDITVTVAVNAASVATRGSDYIFIDPANAPINTPTIDIVIPAGQRSATLDLTSLDDALDEFPESIFVDIVGILEGTEAPTSPTDPEQQVEIIIDEGADDDLAIVTLTADRIGIREIPSEVSTLTAELNKVVQKDTRVTLDIVGGDALPGTDYTVSTLIVDIPAGSTTGTVLVTALPDQLREFDETVEIEIVSVEFTRVDGSSEFGVVGQPDQHVEITILDKKPEADEVQGIFVEKGGASVINGQTQSADPDRRVTGAIEDVLTHPTNPDIIYIGAINGGIWKTENATDANPTWVPQTDDLESLSIGAIEFDLDDPTSQSLVAGTGRFSSFGSAGGLQGRVYVTDDGGDTWESPGSQGLEGENISGIARKGDVIVVTSSEGAGGIFRSTDRGVTFTPVNGPDFVSDGSTNFFDLVADPTTENRLYAAAEDTGIYRSDDFGLTWNKITGIALGLGDNAALDDDLTNTLNNNLEMSIQPITGRLYLGVVIAGRVGGVYYTSDGDTANPTWTEMDVPRLPAGAASPITGAAGTPITITSAGHGLGNNDNVVVRNVQGNTNANGYWRVRVTGPDTFELIGSTSGPAAYVANSGEWVPVTSPSPGFKDIDETGSQGRIHFSITAHPTDPNLVYIGGDRQEQPNVIGDFLFGGSVFRGDASIPRDDTGVPSPQWDHATNNPTAFDPDGGTASNSGPHADSRDMAFDANGELIQVDDGGIFRRTSPEDNTGDWFSLAGDMGTVEYHSIAYDSNSDLILGGTQDNGTHVQVAPDSNTFRMFNGGDGGDVAVDDVSLAGNGESIRYVSSQFLGGFRRITVDAAGNQVSSTGISLTPTTSGIGVQPQFYTPIALNHLFPTQMVIGAGNGVFESFNQGDSVDLTGAGIRATGSAAGPLDYGGRSAVNGDNRYVIYAGDVFGRVHVRTEANGAFVASPDLGGSIRDVEMDPAEWTRAFAVNSTSVWMTEDAGQSWTNITENLSAFGAGQIFSIQYIDGGTSGVTGIVIGTDRGTFARVTNSDSSPNGLGTWFRFGSGMPDVQIRDMDYDAADDVLILGTLGRGAWCLKDASQFLLPNVVLSTDTLFVNEDGSQTATVTARLSRVNPDSDVIIALDSNGTATFTEVDGTTAPGTGPDDYVRNAQGGAGDPANWIRIPAGELFGYATFTPIDDAIYELDEVIEIEASIVTPAGETPEAQLYIRNESFTETLTYSDSPNAVIADVSTQDFTINVPDVGVVNDLTLTLDFLNSDTFDLTAELIGPDGTSVMLFDMDGPAFADALLDAFDGRPSAGTWTLRLTDNVLTGQATLTSWSLAIDRTVESTALPSITIIDDEEAPLVLLESSETEIHESGTPTDESTLTVRLVDSSGTPVVTERPVSVNLSVNAASTATNIDDYNIASTTLLIDGNHGEGVTSETTTLTAVNDLVYEVTETVVIDIDSVTDAVEDGAQQVSVDIIDNESAPAIRIVTDVTDINEAGTAPTQAVVTVELYDPVTGDPVEIERPITVTIAVNGAGTATVGDDFTLDAMTLLIDGQVGAPQTSASTTITAVDDPHYELPETVIVDITNVDDAGVDTTDGAQQVTVTINDDEETPSVRLVTDVTTINEDFANSTAAITAELFDPITGNLVLAERPVSVDLEIDAASTAFEILDYFLADLTLNFNGTAGSGLAQVSTTLDAFDDDIYELSEDVIVNILSATDANIDGADADTLPDGPQSVTVTIEDNEATPSLRLLVDATDIAENGGVATLTAELYDPVTDAIVFAERPVTFDLSLAGTATELADYTLADSTLTIPGDFDFAIDQISTTITANQDDIYELPETVIAEIVNPVDANIGTPAAVTVTIVDDEATPEIRLSVNETAINEDGSAPGVATLTAELYDPVTGNVVQAERPVTVDLITSGTANSGADYDLADSTLTIPGSEGNAESQTTTTITALQDLFYELPETVIVDLDNAANATIGTPAQVTVTINDDEATPSIRLLVDETVINEDGTAPNVATLTAQLFDPATGDTVEAERPVTVDLAITGTANIDDDFIIALQSLLINGDFGAPVSSASTTVTAEQDDFYEVTETVIATLTNADQANIGSPDQQVISIVDEEEVPSIRIVTDEDTLNENGTPGVATVSVELFNPTTGMLVSAERPVTATIAVDALSTATGGGVDYTLAGTTLTINGTFGSPVNAASTTVTAEQDLIYELPETVIINLTSVTDAVVDGNDADTDPDGPQTVTVTIEDDEATPEVELYTSSSPTSTSLFSSWIEFEDSGEERPVIAVLVDPVTGNRVTTERPVTVDIVVDGSSTATAGADFALRSNQLVINGAPGAPQTEARDFLDIIDDDIYEVTETAVIRIDNVDNAVIGDPGSFELLILDDETTPSVRLLVDEANINEDGTPGTATITAELFDPSTGAVVQSEREVTVTLSVAASSTASASDYVLAGTTLTIAGSPGNPESSDSTTITAFDDDIYELTEIVNIDIQSVANGVEAGNQRVVVSIGDNEVTPSVRIAGDPLSINEDGTAPSEATVTVEIFDPLTGLPVVAERPIDVTLAIDAASTAAEDDDYSIGSKSLTIAGSPGTGATTATTTVSAIDDNIFELDETVIVAIAAVTDANIDGADADTDPDGPQQTTITIVEDEIAPTVTLDVNNITTVENGGITVVTATLSHPVQAGATVTVGLSGAAMGALTAGPGIDFLISSLDISVDPGELSGSVSVTAVQDTLDEPDEDIVIDVVGTVNATEATEQQQTITIIDDDDPVNVLLTIDQVEVAEGGGTAVITATLTDPNTAAVAPSGFDVTVNLMISGTATLGIDYTLPASIMIPAGDTSASITLESVTDNLDEADETVIVDIDTLTNGVELNPQQVTATIIDADVLSEVTLDASPLTIGENGDTASFRLSLDVVSGKDITVNLNLGGSATGGGVDYNNPALQYVIPAGDMFVDFSIDSVPDALNEIDETIVVSVSSLTNAVAGGAQQQTITILDDDPVPTVTLSIDETSILEDAGDAQITATLSAVSGRDVIVDLGFSGTADRPDDYLVADQILIPAGQMSASVQLNAILDGKDEFDELATIEITDVTNALEDGTQSVDLTIVDSDVEPTVSLSVSADTVREDAGTVTFFATLDAESGKDVTVNLQLLGEAVEGEDYTAGPVTVQIPAGSLQAEVVLTLIEDGIDEFDELAIIEFVSVVNAVENIVQQSSTLIEDVDDAPLVSVTAGQLDLIEANGDSSVITVSLSEASEKPVQVFLNFGGTATAIDDYTGRVGSVMIPEGQTSANFTLTARDDSIDESDETIDVTIASIVNAAEDGTQLATVTIVDDDDMPGIQIIGSPAGILEDTETGTFTLELTEAAGRDIEVGLIITGTATPDDDYTALPTTVTIPAGSTSLPITLAPIADVLVENDEDVTVQIDAASTPFATTTAGTDVATITILNDEALPDLDITANVASIGEGGGDAILTLTLSAVSGRDITIDLATSGAATEGADYLDIPDQVVIPAGTTSMELLLTTVDDNIDEFDEDAIITISGAEFAAPRVDSATITIIDNDPDAIVSMSVSDATIAEEGGTSTVTVTLDQASEKPVTITLAPAGTAINGTDYETLPTTVTVPAGETSVTFDVVAISDIEVESQETVILSLAGVENGVFDGLTQTVSIVDDDVPTLFVAFDDDTVNEADGVAATMATITRNASLAVPMIVTLTSSDTGEATSQMTLSFEANSATVRVPVDAINDFILDGSQTVTFTATAAGFEDGTADLVVEDATTAVNLSVDVNAGTEDDQTVITITATTDKPVIGDQTLDLTVGGTDITASDYVLAQSTLNFADGESSATTTFTVQDDSLVEALLETATISISSSTNGLAAGPDDSVDVTITDNDAATLTIGDVTVTEGDSGTVTAILDVSLAGQVDSTFTVDYATADGTAVAGTDYNAASGQLTFNGNDGETQQISIEVRGDEFVELDEAFLVNLMNVAAGTRNVTISDASGDVTITNDDSASVSIADVTVDEGDSGTTIVTFTATLDSFVDAPVTLDYATVDGTATVADLDYASDSGSITFPANTPGLTTTFSVVVIGDEKVELDETFQAVLSNLTAAGRNVTIADDTADATIVNDDQAMFSIDNVTIVEGDSGVQDMTFTVTLDNAVDTPVNLDVDTRNVTALFNEDYQPNTGSVLSFSGAAGETQSFTVLAFGDTKVELDETFNVLLSNVAAAGRDVTVDPNAGVGVGTIENDDSATITMVGGEVTEGDSGTTEITFTVALDNMIDRTVTLDYSTLDGSASAADGDYDAVSGTLVFGPNVAGTQSQTITVTVNGDTKVELDEFFFLDRTSADLGGLNITLADQGAIGDIFNDDSATVSIADLTMDEGNDGTTNFGFEVTIDAEVDIDVTLLLNTTDGTADATDYTSVTDQMVTLSGNTGGPQTVLANVEVSGDTLVERSETFFAMLSGLNAQLRDVTLVGDSATATIVNDDVATISIDDMTIDEGDADSTEVTFTVTLDASVDHDVQVNYETEDQSATAADGDYTAVDPGTLMFPANSAPGTTQTITVSVHGDQKVELNETFLMNLSQLLSGERAVSFGDDSGAVSIINDDSASVTIADITQTEGDSGVTNFEFTATLTNEIDVPMTFLFEAVEGTATFADDLPESSGTVTLPANAGVGEQTTTFNVSVNGDVKVEEDEMFTVLFSQFMNMGRDVTLDTSEVSATIVNDDVAEVSVSDTMIVEGTGGSSTLVFDITLDAEVEEDVTVSYRSLNTGSALAGLDFTSVNGSVTFPGSLGTGAQTIQVTIPIRTDAIVELDETIDFEISDLVTDAANVSIADSTATGTIVNDDTATLTISSESALEGDTEAGSMTFTVTLDNEVDMPDGSNISFSYSFQDGTATQGTDYVSTPTQTLTFSGTAGETQSILVNTVADELVEGDETFTIVPGVILAGGRDVVAATDGGAGTIINDDISEVLVDDIEVTEGDAGTVNAVFTIRLSKPVVDPVSVRYFTEDNTATIADGDYNSASGTVDITSGSATVTVTVNSDTVVEGDETFWLNLTGLQASGQAVNLTGNQAVATIVNDDTVNLSIGNATVREGYGQDQRTLDFVVTRDNTSVPVTFVLTTTNGTASGNDYSSISRQFTMEAGGDAQQVVSVDVTGDHRVEENETVIATLTSPTLGANITQATGTGTIVNDDGFITGLKFHDANDNGQRDAGEGGLAGWSIRVLDDGGNVLSTAVTTADGTYSLEVNEGTWAIEEVQQDGWRQSFPGAAGNLAYQLDQDMNIRFTGKNFLNWGGLNEKWYLSDDGWVFITPEGNLFLWDGSGRDNLTGDLIAALGDQYYEVPSLLYDAQPTVDREVTVVAGQTVSDIDFGNVPTGRIEGRKFHDVDADGFRDRDEPWLNGWTVTLTNSAGEVVGTAVTDDLDLNGDGFIDPATEKGWYQFDNLLPDTYEVSEEVRAGWSQNGADGPFASLAYELDQALDFRQPADDFFNWGGRSERWLFGGTDWHFITPDGQLFRWDRSPASNLTGDLVATLDSTYWQDLSLLYNARRPNQYTISINGQQVTGINFANTFGHDGTGSGNVQVAMSGTQLTITGDSAGNTVQVYVDEANDRTVVTTSGSTLNGERAPYIIDTTTLGGLNVQLGDGNDQFILLGATLTGAATINSGSGNDRVSLGEVTTSSTVAISNPGGTDTRRIVDSDLRGVTLSGAGSSAVADSVISGGLTSQSGGVSRLAVANSTITGTLDATGSASGDRFLMFQSDINRLDISGAGGNDVLALIGSSFDTALNVNLDTGNDSIALKSGNTFGGGSLNGGGGSNRIASDGTSAAISTNNATSANSQLESLIDIALSSFEDLGLDL